MSAVSIQIYEKIWSGRAVFLNIELTQTQWGLLNSNEYVGFTNCGKKLKVGVWWAIWIFWILISLQCGKDYQRVMSVVIMQIH